MLVTLVFCMSQLSRSLWSLVGPDSILALLAHVEPVFPRFPAVSLCTGGLYTLVICNFGYLFVHPPTGTLQPGFVSLFSTSEILAGHDAGGREMAEH